MNIEISIMSLDDVLAIKDEFYNSFDEFWRIEILQEELQHENSKYLVAKLCGEIVGFAGIKIILDEAEIMNIVIRKDKRNQGIASSLLSELIQIAYNSNCSTILLEVNENNLPAIHLYEKFSFERIGLRKKYYNNTDNAILMKKDISVTYQGGTNEKQK